jgi:signal transduction histidine kinase
MRIREAAARLGYYGIPLALAVGGTVEYLLEDVPASLWLTLPLLYASLSPLLLRRRFPFAAPLAALGILVLESAVNGRAVTQPATPLFLGIFCFALFAAYNSELRAVTGAMVGLAAIALVEADSPKATNVLAYFFIFVLALIGWSGGLAFRRRAQNEQELRDRAERLELAREAEAERAAAAERTRIAREIHDIVAHNVSVMVLQARGGPAHSDTTQPTRAKLSARSSRQEAEHSPRCGECSASCAATRSPRSRHGRVSTTLTPYSGRSEAPVSPSTSPSKATRASSRRASIWPPTGSSKKR